MAKKTISVQDVETPTTPVETTNENNETSTSTGEGSSTTEEPTEPKEEPKKETEEPTEPKEEPKEDPQTPETPSKKPATDVNELKKKGFITHVITPETLTKENLADYVTQVGVASGLYKDLENNSSEKK